MRTVVSEIQMFPVYAADRNGAPITWVNVEDAQWLLQSGGADWITRRGRALRLRKCKEEVRGSSSRMGQHLIVALASKSDHDWAIAILDAWKINHSGSLPSQSGRNGRIAHSSFALARTVQHLPATT